MNNRCKRILSKLKSIPYILNGFARPSYAQFGEDRILEYIFKTLNIEFPTYIDIGANHPVKGSNTYFLYTQGSRGILIEPDPKFHSLIRKARKGDTLLTSGIALNESKSEDFFIYSDKYNGWNTFSLEEVEVRRKMGIEYVNKIQVPLLNVNTILEKYFKSPPDLLSLDVEGLDEEILRSFDFDKYSPKVICVEIVRFGESDYVEQQQTIIDFLSDRGYILFANTKVNGIFVNNKTV